jgi:hypothetical protein
LLRASMLSRSRDECKAILAHGRLAIGTPLQSFAIVI